MDKCPPHLPPGGSNHLEPGLGRAQCSVGVTEARLKEDAPGEDVGQRRLLSRDAHDALGTIQAFLRTFGVEVQDVALAHICKEEREARIVADPLRADRQSLDPLTESAPISFLPA